MAAVTIHSDLGAQKNKVCLCFHFFPIYLPWNDGTGCHAVRFFECWFFFLETHWTHFYWAPTMYTRHWPRCWWYKYSRRENRQKPHPLQSSWSLHSCEIKARKLIHGEKHKLWAKEQFLWGVTKWIPILEVRKKQWSPYGVTQNHRTLLSSLTQAWERKGSVSLLLQSKGGGQCTVLPRRSARPFKSLSPNHRKAMVVQICFNQDNSLSNMKFNEDEHYCQQLKKNTQRTIKQKLLTV